MCVKDCVGWIRFTMQEKTYQSCCLTKYRFKIQISKYEIQVQRKQTLLFHGLVRFNQDTILQYVHNLAGVAVEFSDGDASLKPDSWLVFETHRPHEGGTYLYVHNAYFSESCSDKQVFYYC